MTTRPTEGSLVDWLRNEASRPFTAPTDDRQDQVALEWLRKESEQSDDRRLLDAVEALLKEGNAVVTSRILEITLFASPEFRFRVARAIGDAPSAFQQNNPSTSRTLLGDALRALGGKQFSQPLPASFLDQLPHVSREEDGWPSNVTIGIRATPARFAPALSEAIERANPGQLLQIARTVVTLDDSAIREALSASALGATVATRERFLAACKQALEDLEEARAFVAQKGLVPQPGRGPKDLTIFQDALGL